MNLHGKLLERQAAGRPITIGLIGAGKFGTMFLSQVRVTDGMHLVGVADLNVGRARGQLASAGWPAEAYEARSLDEAVKSGGTHVGDDALALIAHPAVEVIIEATGDPRTGIRFCLAAIDHGKPIVMVNVEADALAGPLLAQRARQAGVVYSLAYGDQPALICEQVDWARTAGFRVVAAGKGTRYHPTYHQSTPDTVWEILDKYLRIDDRQSINPKMFNSFIDGTKSAIEMTAVATPPGSRRRATASAFRRPRASSTRRSASRVRQAACWRRPASPR
jgi:predicted homoserine dehydrogenase-like protein